MPRISASRAAQSRKTVAMSKLRRYARPPQSIIADAWLVPAEKSDLSASRTRKPFCRSWLNRQAPVTPAPMMTTSNTSPRAASLSACRYSNAVELIAVTSEADHTVAKWIERFSCDGFRAVLFVDAGNCNPARDSGLWESATERSERFLRRRE